MGLELRDYQKQVIKDLYGHFRRGKRRALVFAPTGAGKSLIAAKLVCDGLSRNKRILIVAHRKALVGQLAGTIEAFCGHKPAIIAPGKKQDYDNPVQIAMAQTLHRRKLPENIDILLGDEAHITTFMAIWRKCLDAYCGKIWAFSKAYVVGFTATPWRTNNKEGFCHLFDCIVKAPSPRKLIEMGYLTHPRLFSYKSIDTERLKLNKDGDYDSKSLAIACDERYNQDVYGKWKDLCDKKKTIVFAANVKQAKGLLELFKSGGYNSELITGADGNKQREEVFDRFKKGITQVLVNIGCLSEGFDETSIECALIARPTRSAALLIQMVGRSLRLHPGKQEVYVIDCGECFSWLTGGTYKGEKVEDPIDLSFVPLCPTWKPKAKEANLKECPNCQSKIPQFARICPDCEFEIPQGKKDKQPTLHYPELEEFFTSTSLKQFQWLRKELAKHYHEDKEPSQIFHKFHRKYGFLPPHDWFIGAVFGCKNSRLHQGVYLHHLQRIKTPERAIAFLLTLEFGESDRVYKINGLKYEKQHALDFDPNEYLGETKDVKQAYIDNIHTKDSTALNYCLKVLKNVKS